MSVLYRLTRGHLVAAGIALLALAAVGVLLGVFARGWWDGAGGSYAPPQPLAGSVRVVPERSLFGDPLTARVDLLVDPRRVDPRTLDVNVDLGPYHVLGSSRRVQHVGRADAVSYAYTIQCITAACISMTRHKIGTHVEQKPVQLPPAHVTGRLRGGGTTTLALAWSPFVVAPRVTPIEVAEDDPRLPSGFTPPRVTWSITPGLLGGLLVGVAAVLVLGAAWLLAGDALRDARRLRVARIPANLTPVERALALAQHAAARGEDDEGRKALERLARELRRSGAASLAEHAGTLAWSPEGPTEDAVDELAGLVRGSNGARRR